MSMTGRLAFKAENVAEKAARTNAATALYRSLGFQVEGGDDVYQAMTWTPAPVTVVGAAG